MKEFAPPSDGSPENLREVVRIALSAAIEDQPRMWENIFPTIRVEPFDNLVDKYTTEEIRRDQWTLLCAVNDAAARAFQQQALMTRVMETLRGQLAVGVKEIKSIQPAEQEELQKLFDEVTDIASVSSVKSSPIMTGEGAGEEGAQSGKRGHDGGDEDSKHPPKKFCRVGPRVRRWVVTSRRWPDF
uniref:Uncharacterized protein n=1 Tax=Chromera velia CCMP2878 TaxID=1169474 RepID=A0A0G4H0Q7_9ALVE|mmetsp:Transcript_47015/g.92823  ORF Transcript_47015/g.92823 Transcript_47015/m.92823 type:complete len:186 (+) Transcript_47015:257-814(+)|eukprot:Cvel_24154.t1-p1 / transcript=Cvel_24154.t1 / gene=Cvel_24154 / organism=Chromera_velia_CCMP2878 / gene_product=hypothetical protein / transcript_product=hypothetical protein / location=Cvel_scaffold2578:15675-16229(+) / protein_length=185 / sequence_SO=supercontig / SO=protein_coding / is_pseudo=false